MTMSTARPADRAHCAAGVDGITVETRRYAWPPFPARKRAALTGWAASEPEATRRKRLSPGSRANLRTVGRTVGAEPDHEPVVPPLVLVAAHPDPGCAAAGWRDPELGVADRVLRVDRNEGEHQRRRGRQCRQAEHRRLARPSGAASASPAPTPAAAVAGSRPRGRRRSRSGRAAAPSSTVPIPSGT